MAERRTKSDPGKAVPQAPQGRPPVADSGSEPHTNTDPGKAMPAVPQGQDLHADLGSEPHTPPDPGKADLPMPQGRRPVADPGSAPIIEGEEGHRDRADNGHAPPADLALDDLCGSLMALQRDRVFAIRMQSRCERAVEAYIRIRLGFTTDPEAMSETDRKRLSKMALAVKRAIETGAELPTGAPANIAQACSAVVLSNLLSREPWDRQRKLIEKEMERLAKLLPAWPFAQSVAGVSAKGLAIIVGEAGNLALYPKKGHLWKRLGLAVIDGRRQGNPGAAASAEDWIRHGYKKARRAEIWALLDDVMLRQQWQGGEARGPYGAHYARKKAEYVERFADDKGALGHADKAARRYMAKMFLRDLWNAWREAMTEVPKGQKSFASRCATKDAA